MKFARNFLGAFADGAILFPLLMTLSFQNGMNLFLLLASSGLAYLIAGFVFRVPMSVQPLKSVAIAGLAIGATAIEIRSAAVLLGCIFAASLAFDLDALAKKVPERLIHGIQLGLGLLLALQGLRMMWPLGINFIFLGLLLSGFILLMSFKTQTPVLGLVATLGFFFAIAAPFFGATPALAPSPSITSSLFVTATDLESFRPFLVLSLVLPQIILTSANSVLATVNVSKRFFGDQAKQVTARKLVGMIGFGNILSGLVGGLPFCHGSGGITAHYKGGARTNGANYIIGGVLLGAAALVSIFGGRPVFFPPILVGVLLISVGLLHVSLAAPSWACGKTEKFQLALMGIAAIATGNMLWVLGLGLVSEFFRKRFSVERLFWLRGLTIERKNK
jgi:SulP family sulfate permease